MQRWAKEAAMRSAFANIGLTLAKKSLQPAG
jgi:hypothetical protein